jgi:hypothetical protein
MKTTTSFEQSDRYEFDWGECSLDKGWAQVDSRQDAWYFGTWANPTTRKMLTYVEGDITRYECESDAEFVQHIIGWVGWMNDRGWGPVQIDPGFNHENEIATRFKQLGLGHLLH